LTRTDETELDIDDKCDKSNCSCDCHEPITEEQWADKSIPYKPLKNPNAVVLSEASLKAARDWIRSFQIDGMFIYQRDVDSLATLLDSVRNKAMAEVGKLGGASKSAKKQAASRKNGAKNVGAKHKPARLTNS
jgi:hypothetical protein